MTSYNLLDEPWLPVRLRSGQLRWIAPHQITGPADDPAVALASPRPDFNGALIQLLIGLVQTCWPARDEDQWLDRLAQAPSAEQLRAAFEPHRRAFELLGDGPRFMQDLEGFESEPAPIMELLIDVPTGKTLETNKDHFNKRSAEDRRLSLPAVAATLVTLQMNSPGGGVGYRTSVRGGGPLTTLALGQTLWETVWLNTELEHKLFERHGYDEPDRTPERVYPWLAPTRTSAGRKDAEDAPQGGSEGSPGLADSQDAPAQDQDAALEAGNEKAKKAKKTKAQAKEAKAPGVDTTPLDASPLQALWAMPRRIRLLSEGDHAPRDGECALYGTQGPLLRSMIQTNYGVNYTGPWQHPLSPYLIKDGTYSARKANPRCLEYQHWSALALQDGPTARIASALRGLLALRSLAADEVEALARPLQLWVFGYDMDNAKLRRWYEGVMPFIRRDSAWLREQVERLLAGAKEIHDAQQTALMRALFGGYDPAKGKKAWSIRPGVSRDHTALQTTSQEYWGGTQAEFYETLRRLVALDSPQTPEQEEQFDALKRGWARACRDSALMIFDSRLPQQISCDVDLRTRTLARAELERFTHESAKSVREALGLLSGPTPKED